MNVFKYNLYLVSILSYITLSNVMTMRGVISNDLEVNVNNIIQ